jgi:predicted transcriptional regulator
MQFRRPKNDKPPEIGRLELDILKQFWSAAAELDARMVLERLSGRTISLSTVQATLERLHRKGLLSREKVSRAYLYRTAVSREQLISMLIGDVARRLAENELEPVISGFIDFVGETDPAQLDQLELGAKRRRNRE